MRNHEYYSRQAAGCRRLAAAEADAALAAEIERLARRYDIFAALWPEESITAAIDLDDLYRLD